MSPCPEYCLIAQMLNCSFIQNALIIWFSFTTVSHVVTQLRTECTAGSSSHCNVFVSPDVRVADGLKQTNTTALTLDVVVVSISALGLYLNIVHP